MKLPSGRGDTLLKRIHFDCPAARTVVITGLSDELNECVQSAFAEGADAVCYKPFDVESLLNTIKRLVTS
jgi:DNA-binding NarL/FixJ family response regulator